MLVGIGLGGEEWMEDGDEGKIRVMEKGPAGSKGPKLVWGFSRQDHWSGLPFPSPMPAYLNSGLVFFF